MYDIEDIEVLMHDVRMQLIYFMPMVLPVLSRSCWSASTTSISIYLVVEQSTLLRQILFSNRVDILLIITM